MGSAKHLFSVVASDGHFLIAACRLPLYDWAALLSHWQLPISSFRLPPSYWCL